MNFKKHYLIYNKLKQKFRKKKKKKKQKKTMKKKNHNRYKSSKISIDTQPMNSPQRPTIWMFEKWFKTYLETI